MLRCGMPRLYAGEPHVGVYPGACCAGFDVPDLLRGASRWLAAPQREAPRRKAGASQRGRASALETSVKHPGEKPGHPAQ